MLEEQQYQLTPAAEVAQRLHHKTKEKKDHYSQMLEV
jgi:hypothetical protein